MDPLLLRQLAGLPIVPADSPDRITEPIGTGPYRWAGPVADGRFRLEANKDYWQKGWDDLIRDIEGGQAPAYLIAWSNSVHDLGDVFDHLLHTKDPAGHRGQNNESRFSDPEIDTWIQAAGSTLDPGTRLQLLKRISDAADREAIAIPLIWEMKLWAGTKGIEWHPRSDGILDPYEMRRQSP